MNIKGKNDVMKLVRLVICLVFTVQFFSACGPDESKSEAALKERVAQFWQAKVDKDWSRAYDMTAEAFQKKRSKDSYVRQSNLNFESFEIQNTEILEPGKKARVTVQYKINQMGFEFKKTLTQNWTWENGQWKLGVAETASPNPF
jgi:hypothetical protein